MVDNSLVSAKHMQRSLGIFPVAGNCCSLVLVKCLWNRSSMGLHLRWATDMEENNFGDFCGVATFDRKVAIHNIWAYFSGKLMVHLSLMLPLIEMSSQYGMVYLHCKDLLTIQLLCLCPVHPWIGGTCGILSSSTRTPPSWCWLWVTSCMHPISSLLLLQYLAAMVSVCLSLM